MESTSPEDGIISDTAFAVPLLLNPSYARLKSAMFDELQNFRVSLRWCALDHSSPTGKTISYIAFILFTIIVHAVTSLSFSSTSAFGSVTFNQLVQIPESSLAAITFFTLAAFFRRHGIRQRLLLDDTFHNNFVSIRCCYTRELDHAFWCLAYILLPTFSELAHKILFFATVSMRVPQMQPVIMAATPAAWAYRMGVPAGVRAVPTNSRAADPEV